ncbi:hypothetical protein ABZ172_26825 [Streptomyces sp. NPDC006296]|uniref:hypothetical protein n=1 Tax=Streptomyces sp. NPDC006296 TaxID=3156746 RepID=UPI0033AAE174
MVRVTAQHHVDEPRPGTTYNTYLPDAEAVIIGEQQNFAPNHTAGIDPTPFVLLAGRTGQSWC